MMRDPNKDRNRALIIMLTLILCSILITDITEIPAFSILGIVGVVAYVVLDFIFWVCPYCKKQLPFRSYKLDYCPYCGKRLTAPESDESSNEE